MKRMLRIPGGLTELQRMCCFSALASQHRADIFVSWCLFLRGKTGYREQGKNQKKDPCGIPSGHFKRDKKGCFVNLKFEIFFGGESVQELNGCFSQIFLDFVWES